MSAGAAIATALPEPPPAAGTPALRTVAPGSWWRVHRHNAASGRLAPAQFNDTGLGNARFSPLFDAAGALVPTLYAAATLQGALMETALHDVPYPSQGHIHDLERDLRSDLHASVVDVRRPLQLVDLTKLGLQRMGLRPSQLFETDACDYPRMRRWAAWLHTTLPQAQGLVWLSARQPESAALLLFGDRVPPGAIAAGAGAPRHIGQPDVLAVLLDLLDRLGCGVASDR